MSTDGQRTNGIEILPKISVAWVGRTYVRQTDRRHTDGRLHSERERYTFEYFGEVGGEENIGGLAAAVGLGWRPASTYLKIVPVESCTFMSSRRDSNDAAWRRALQFVQQQIGQEEVTCLYATQFHSQFIHKSADRMTERRVSRHLHKWQERTLTYKWKRTVDYTSSSFILPRQIQHINCI